MENSELKEVNKIKEIRLENNLTQLQFGEYLGISRSHVSSIESGKEKPSKSVIKLISIIFKVEETSLMQLLEVSTVNKIKEIRESSNLTQLEFAEMLGLTESELNNLENDIETPTKQTIKLIALQFGVNENYFTDARN